MTANFLLEGLHRPIIELSPDNKAESILLATFIRYDANSFRVSVDRHEDGRIKTVRIYAETAE